MISEWLQEHRAEYNSATETVKARMTNFRLNTLGELKLSNMVKSNTAKKKKTWAKWLLVVGIILCAIILAILLAGIGAGILYEGFFLGAIIIVILFGPQKYYLDIIALILGICLIAASGFLSFKTQNFISNSIVTEGVVVGYEGRENMDYTPRAIIEFKTSNGDVIRFEDNDKQTPSIGEKLNVIYNPLNPSKARINRWLALWSWTLLTLCVGVTATIIAIRRLRRRPQGLRGELKAA